MTHLRLASGAGLWLFMTTAALCQAPGVPLGPSSGNGPGTVSSVTITAGSNVTTSGACSSTSAINCTLNVAGGATTITNATTPTSGFSTNSLIGAASGNVVTGVTPVDNAILLTNGTGIPAFGLTLDNGFTFAPPANTVGLTVSGYSLTGANAQGMVALSGQWNTTGNPTAFSLSIVDTADGGSAYLMNLLGGTSGTTSEFSVGGSGQVTVAGPFKVGTLQTGTPATFVCYDSGHNQISAASACSGTVSVIDMGTSTTANGVSGGVPFDVGPGVINENSALTFLSNVLTVPNLTISSFTAGGLQCVESLAGVLTLTGSNCGTGAGVAGPQSPGSTIIGNLASWSNTSGSAIIDSGIPESYVPQAITPATANDTQIYPLWPNAIVAGSGIAPLQNNARCAPFTIYPAQHWDELLLDVTTLGTGPLTVALYTDAIDATTKVHQPQTPISSGSGSFIVTGTGVTTVALGTAGVGIPIPAGMDWICTNDANASDLVRFPVIATSSPVIAGLIGTSGAGANVLSTTQFTGIFISETSGTWPSFAGATFTENTGAITPIIGYRPVSVP